MGGGDNASAGDTQSNADTDSNAPSGESSQRNSSVIEDEAEKRLSQAEPENAASGTGMEFIACDILCFILYYTVDALWLKNLNFIVFYTSASIKMK